MTDKPKPDLPPMDHGTATRLAAIVESSEDAIISKSLDGIIQTWNPAAERLFGYTTEEMVGQSIYRLIPRELYDEEESILARISRGQPVAQLETTRVRKDGSLIPISVTVWPVRDASGRIVGASSIKRDMSERRRAAEIEARAAAIIQSSEDAIISKTLDGVIVTWNPAAERIFGYPAGEIVGQSILRLIPPELHEEEERILTQIARGEPVEHYETDRVRKDGRRITIALTTSPIRDRAGNIIGAASIKRDITQQRLTELAIRQAAKMETIGRLAGGLAHDFNNQLHALAGFTHFIARDQGLSPRSRQDLLQVQRAVERMGSMTRQLLAFARQQVLTPETLDLDETIAEMEPLLERLIGSNIEMRFAASNGPKWVKADRAQLVQVLMNLAINARDAMPSGGELRVTTESAEIAPRQARDRSGAWVEPGAYARLTITDTGHGIDPNDLDRIFEPFFTTKTVGHGTGLGLATVEGIVSQSGGYIQVESRPGAGTAMTVLLPLTVAPETGATPPVPEQHPVRFARLLVVDDDVMVRSVITRLLRSAGFEVVEAGNGREGLECVEQVNGAFHLVISDLVMPGMGGREFVETLTRSYPAIPVIWISGHARDSEFPDPSAQRGFPFLQKPVDPDLLLGTVHRTLQQEPGPAVSPPTPRRAGA